MKENINDILIEVNDEPKIKNFIKDDNIIKLQKNLLMMGFDIEMINKVIFYFNIKTENEAIDYLVKSENGMWNHPFIKSKEENLNKNEEINNNIIDNVLNKVKTINNDLLSKDICDICGEIKEFHINNENEDNYNYDLNIDEFGLENNLLSNNYNNNNLDKNEDNKENDNICKICLDEIKSPVELEKCKHQFCQECFEEYINNLINQNNIETIPCPEKKCNNIDLSVDFFSQYITEEQLLKYNHFKIKNEIALDKLKIFCPLCISFAKVDDPENYNPNNPSYKKSELICQKGHKFCSCGRPQHEGECYHDGEEFNNLIIKEKIKNCPKCGFLIKKNSGCNHMTCGNKACKFEFCWLCLQESLPGHYESGPCNGMQFVDPDSLFYRLEQKYPFLYYVFFFFRILLLILILCIFVCFPALLLWIIIGYLLNENFTMDDNDDDKLFILSKSLSIMHYIICIPVLLALQSTVYLSLGITVLCLVLYIAFSILYEVIILIASCLMCKFEEE